MECTDVDGYHGMDIWFTIDAEWARIERSESDLQGISLAEWELRRIKSSSMNDLMMDEYSGWILCTVLISIDLVRWRFQCHSRLLATPCPSSRP
jgi:hypothetical protein